jgi:hypothetical protein
LPPGAIGVTVITCVDIAQTPLAMTSIDDTQNVSVRALDLTDVWDRIDPLVTPFSGGPDPAPGSLPYSLLGGAGFERLCYELLVAEGYAPRFFGVSGQPDYGVDVILEVDHTRTVFQCKNLKDKPSFSDVAEAVTKLKTDWIDGQGLPAPGTFVYCCPQPLTDVDFGIRWTRFKDNFLQSTGTNVILWDRDALDTRLRNRPDIVAGLFSDAHAEFFCGADRWRLDDPWTRVQWGEPRHASLRRFLDRHARKTIYISKQEEDGFESRLRAFPVVIVRGLPGTGKTSLVLELASRERDPVRRMYYATLEDHMDPDRLWQAARRRTSLPSVFILDDCEKDLNRAALVYERLLPELRANANRLVLLMRDLPRASARQIDDTPDWLTQAEQDGAVFDTTVSIRRTRAITTHLRPDLAGLSPARLQRLHGFCAGDLLLLDEFLAGVDAATELDSIQPDALYASLRTRYFGGNAVLPAIRTLACLAQFDLLVAAAFLDPQWRNDEKQRAAPLTTELFAPPRYRFLHSSLAELVLRAQLALEVRTEEIETSVQQVTSDVLRSYLHYLLAREPGAAGCAEVIRALESMLRIRPSLMDPMVVTRIATTVLEDDRIHTALAEDVDECSLYFLHQCLSRLTAAGSGVTNLYLDLIEKRFALLLTGGNDPASSRPRGIRFALLTLSRHAPERLDRLTQQYPVARFLEYIAGGTLNEFLGFLQWAPFPLADAVLTAIDDRILDEQIEREIHRGGSMVALKFAMRAMGRRHPALIERFEKTFGAMRILRLVQGFGTLHDLFAILEHSTAEFRRLLLDRLDTADIDHLLERLIARGQSIGTMHFAIRALGKADPDIVSRLEPMVGGKAFLRLILANGSFFEFLRLLQTASPGFRKQLLDELDERTVTALIDRTIAAERSIGAMPMVIGFMRRDDPATVERLFALIDAAQMLKLLVVNGSLYELMRLAAALPASFRADLLRTLDEATANRLVQKAIAAERSLTALSYATGSLAREDPESLAILERRIGAPALMRLILANGTVFVFFDLLRHATPDFHQALMAEFAQVREVLVHKALSPLPGVATIAFGLRGIREKNRELLPELEKALGVDWFLSLLADKGTITDFFHIFRGLLTLREEVLSRLDEAFIDVLVARAIATKQAISAALSFTIRDLRREDPVLLSRLEQKIGAARFLSLIVANGSLVELFYICHHATPAFVSDVFRHLDASDGETLVARMIGRGRSIEMMHYFLHRPVDQRASLETSLGVAGWWRLIRALGTLNSLTLIADTMTERFYPQFIDASVELGTSEWGNIIRRGYLAHACTFLRGKFESLPPSSREVFIGALETTALEVVAGAKWADLNATKLPTGSKQHEILLRTLFRHRMENAHVDEIAELEFEEAANALACTWRERPDLRSQLVDRWCEIVPASTSWPKTARKVAAIGFILDVARSHAVPATIASSLLHDVNAFLDREICAGLPTGYLVQLVWHMGALRFERGPTASFEETLSTDARDVMLEVLAERIQRNAMVEERIAQFGLAGVLAYLLPQHQSALRRLLKPLQSWVVRVRKVISEESFVPAFFTLEGTALLQGGGATPFTPFISVGLMMKARDETAGPALDSLLRRAKLAGVH